MFRRTETDAINHHMWVISYADMVTLLFALFVVLYSLGEVKLSKLRELRQSLAFAFSYEGDVLDDDDSVFDRGDRANRLEGLSLVYSLDPELRLRLMETLPDRFEQLTGRPLEVSLSDDFVEFRSTLDAFYEAGATTLRTEVQHFVTDLLEVSLSFTTHVTVGIHAPNVVTGTAADGGAVRPGPLCMRRLEHILRFMPLVPRVLIENVDTEFHYTLDREPDWEAIGTIGFRFSRR